MKRIALITLIAATMISLFAANQTWLLAKSSATASEAMRTANQLYEAGQFAQATQAYEQLVAQGYTDGALFYNLGNAYFKQDDLGRAIVNYRRAQQLAPRDKDIKANLALARAQAVDQLEIAESGGLASQLGGAVQGLLTLNELAMLTLGAWLMLVFLFILHGSVKAGSSWRKSLRYALTVAAVVFAVGVLALGSYLYVDRDLSAGVIVTAEVDVTSGPGTQYVTAFTLHSGAEVDLVEVRGSWSRLTVPDGELEGWVPTNAVEAIGGESLGADSPF
jgi:hypothetical protein